MTSDQALRTAIWSWQAMSQPDERAHNTFFNAHLSGALTLTEAPLDIIVTPRRLSFSGRDAIFAPERLSAADYGRLLCWVLLGQELPLQSPTETWKAIAALVNPKAGVPALSVG